LAGGIEDFIDERFAVGVLEGEDVARDLDEVGIQFALVPFLEDFVHLVGIEAEAGFHQVVRLTDELHVAVLDAVVDHLHVVPGTIGADPVAAGGAVVGLGGDGLENFLHVRPRGLGSAGHDGGPMARAFLAAGNAGADELQPARLDVACSADGVLIK